MSLHSLLTVLLLIPASPTACTRSSTRRVETPPANPGLLDHRHQNLLRRLAGLQEGREVAALPQLGDPQLQAAQPRVQCPVAIPIAICRPVLSHRMFESISVKYEATRYIERRASDGYSPCAN
jgi:hypothetical protein